MPKSNREEANKTRQRIIDAAIQILSLKTSEDLTFTNIASVAEISRSGINAHFKRKSDIEKALEPIIRQRMEAKLKFGSPEVYLKSWKKMIDTDEELVRLIVNSRDILSGKEGIDRTISMINGDREEVQKSVFYAIGYFIYSLQ